MGGASIRLTGRWPGSGADFFVEFQPPPLPGISDRRHGLHEDLCAALGRRVDLIGKGAIRNRYLKEAIDRSRELVYEA
ncbi:MAG: hypothetical protein OXN84_22235 [Albidovulum sp.]|nr:hypothetical protein [Albidovulum sp.]